MLRIACSIIFGQNLSRKPKEKQIAGEIISEVGDNSPVKDVHVFDFLLLIRVALVLDIHKKIDGCRIFNHEFRVKVSQPS